MSTSEGLARALLTAATAQGQAAALPALAADLMQQLSLPIPTISGEPAPSESAATLLEPHAPLLEPLTPRELEVLRLLCVGETNGEIAAKLGIAIGTVKFYTSQIYGKLGVRNRVTAVARARELHLISA